MLCCLRPDTWAPAGSTPAQELEPTAKAGPAAPAAPAPVPGGGALRQGLHTAWSSWAVDRLLGRHRAAAGTAVQQRGLQALAMLSFVNTGPSPPEPWVEAHQLLLQGLDAALAAQAPLLHACHETFTLGWYTQLQARLHINCFR